jgi:uncharacterized membrane-anchored protein
VVVNYKISDRIDKMVRKVITERHKGQFRRGMLQEFVENALMRYICEERKDLAEAAHTHKIERRKKKRDLLAEEASHLNGLVMNYALENYSEQELENGITKEMAEKALVKVGKDGRTVGNNIALLEAYGWIKERKAEVDIRPLLTDLK